MASLVYCAFIAALSAADPTSMTMSTLMDNATTPEDSSLSNWTLSQEVTTTLTSSTHLPQWPGRSVFRLPPMHEGSGRHGPYFEDGQGPHNVTVRQGSTALLDCRIGLLGGKTVSWLHRKHDNMQLLTFGRQAYSADQRITLSFRYPGNWRLQISYATRRDQGLYECQVATHPPRALKVYLTVTAPEVVVMDENDHVVSERYYKAGSAVELTCLATRLEAPMDRVLWKHGEKVLVSGVSNNMTSPDGSTVESTLSIASVQKRHSGNYSCSVGSLAAARVAVHILNGELPAAVQHSRGTARHWRRWSLLALATLVSAIR